MEAVSSCGGMVNWSQYQIVNQRIRGQWVSGHGTRLSVRRLGGQWSNGHGTRLSIRGLGGSGQMDTVPDCQSEDWGGGQWSNGHSTRLSIRGLGGSGQMVMVRDCQSEDWGGGRGQVVMVRDCQSEDWGAGGKWSPYQIGCRVKIRAIFIILHCLSLS